MSTKDEQTFTFRVIKTTYKNYLSYDEGPGSLTSVDATKSARVVNVWKHKPESFGEWILDEGHPDVFMEDDSDDGYYEYSYSLQRTRTGVYEWECLGTVPRMSDLY